MQSRRLMAFYLACVMTASLLSGMGGMDAEGKGGSFGGGSGTLADPYVIEDVEDLQAMGDNLTAHYVLGNDIDAAATSTWNGGAGFAPVGDYPGSFTGSLNGAGYNITGLCIDRPTADCAGLFGYMGTGSSASNLSMVDVSITGRHNVGALVGWLRYGTLTDCDVSGVVDGPESSSLGGAGGLVGFNAYGTVKGSSATADVSGLSNVGGLIGWSTAGTVTDCYALGNVSGHYYVGGFVGQIFASTMSDCYAIGNVNGSGTDTGGFAGYSNNCNLKGLHASGHVSGDGYDVGGLVGHNLRGSVTDCYALGDVNGAVGYVGGLIGNDARGGSSGAVSRSYATGNVSGLGVVGGLVGFDDGAAVSYCYSTGTVDGGGYVGGLVGFMYPGSGSTPSVSNCYSTGSVNGSDTVGGLVGTANGPVSYSYASGNVSAESDFGGLVGYLDYFGGVTGCFYDSDTSGCSDVGKGSPRTTAEMMTQTTFRGAGWDLTSAWWMVDGYTRPFLRMEWGTEVRNSHQLQLMGMDVTADYTLVRNIDLSDIVEPSQMWGTGPTAGAGFAPIAEMDSFTGSLDGMGFDITGLFIQRASIDEVGLFSYLDTDASVVNVTLIGTNVTGRTDVGSLVAYSAGTVSNCSATGSVIGESYVGGLAGVIEGPLSNSQAGGSVSGHSDVGALVGGISDLGLVSNSHYNISSVLINGGHHVTLGGLFGPQFSDWLDGGMHLNISHYSTSLVPSGGAYEICDVQGLRDLLGFSDVEGYGFRLAADIDLSTAPGLYIPYLAAAEFDGDNHTISNLDIDMSFASRVGMFGAIKDGTVRSFGLVGLDVSGYAYVGGLAGCNGGTVTGSYTTGRVNGTEFVGGLVGSNDHGTVDGSYSKASVTGSGNTVGGLVGYNENGGMVNASYATGNVTNTGGGSTGGLVGANYLGTVIFSHATGAVTGPAIVGGLVGGNYYQGGVSNSYATGNVTGKSDVGGLVGLNYGGTVSNTYAWGTVTGSDRLVGGLVGDNRVGSSVSYSYATGRTTGGNNVGGLAGASGGTVSACFWDTETTGQDTSAGGTGRTTAEMMTRSTFTDAGWDFTSIWCMVEDVTYPLLRWQDVEPPVADAGPDQVVDEGTLVTLDGSGSGDDIGIANYTWTLMDGAAVTLYGVRPEYRFDNPGAFVVTLNVTDAVGNWDTDEVTVTVNDTTAPIADAGPDQVVDEGTPVTFEASGSSDNVGVVNYTWTFTDGVPMTLYGIGPTYRFETPGTFLVTLNVTDAAGNWNTDEMTVTVNDTTPPVADAGADRSVAEGTLVAFNGSGCTDNVGIVDYVWTFTEGALVTLHGVQPTHQFNAPGLFVVTLNVTDAAGNWNIDIMTVTVNDVTAPVADAGADQAVDEGTLVTFDGSGSSDNVGIVDYLWSFTDGVPVVLHGVAPTYLFGNIGEFVVTLNVTDATGNRNTDIMTVTVNDVTPPVADAELDRTVDEGTLVAFDGSGSSDNHGIVDYTWTFTDGTLVTLYGVQPTHRFDAPGLFVVTLKVTDAAGIWNEDTMIVTVNDITPPVADAGPDQTVDEGARVTLDGSGSTDNVGGVNYTWLISHGNETVQLYGASVSFTSTVPDVYYVVLRVSDAAGNTGEDAMTLTIVDVTPPVVVAGADRTVAAGTAVQLDGSLSSDNVGVANYTWTFIYDGQARALTGAAVQFTFEKGGVYAVILTAADGAGNHGNDTVIITVVDTGKVTGIVLDEDGKPVKDATVVVTASDGKSYTATTAANGTFSLDVYHGDFTWSISKKGYKVISGSSAVSPMGSRELDLTDHPLVKEEEGGIFSILFLGLAVVLILIVVLALYISRRKRKG